MRYERISADCHIDLPWMPPDLFVSSATAGLKDRMPYVAEGPEFDDAGIPHRWMTKLLT